MSVNLEKPIAEDAVKPIVAMISNCLSDENRKMGIETFGHLTEGIINPLKFSYKNNHGILPIIEVTPQEIFSVSGMKKAKEYFVKAVDHSVKEGVRVVLLAASTKRLFDKGAELKALFPDTIFTIGDNGTALAFINQIQYVSRDMPKDSPIVVLGAGFLGEVAIEYLESCGFTKIIVISRHRCKNLSTCMQFSSLDEYIESLVFEGADLLLGCAHNHNIQASQINALLNKKLVIIDVAVPKAVPHDVFTALKDNIYRFDGGDFDIQNLKLHFPPQVSGLSFDTEFYGCFTEAFVLAMSGYKGDADFFHVTESNMKLVNSLIKKYNNDFLVSMKNFGKPVVPFESVLTF